MRVACAVINLFGGDYWLSSYHTFPTYQSFCTRMKTALLYLNFCLVFLSGFDCFSQTIFSVQDGNWEDSTTWNVHAPLADSVAVDSIIILHHIVFNDSLYINSGIVIIDTNASLCGHYTIHLKNCTGYSYGQFFSTYLMIESSHFYVWYGMVTVRCLIRLSGAGGYSEVHGGGEKVGWDFDCTTLTSWKDPTSCGRVSDTSSHDTVVITPIKPTIIKVNPNPFMNDFTISSEVPDSTEEITFHVFDLLGREMKTISIPKGSSSITVLTRDRPAGVYCFRFLRDELVIKSGKMIRVK